MSAKREGDAIREEGHAKVTAVNVGVDADFDAGESIVREVPVEDGGVVVPASSHKEGDGINVRVGFTTKALTDFDHGFVVIPGGVVDQDDLQIEFVANV